MLYRWYMQRVVRSAQRITGGKLPALQDTYSTRCHRKAKKIIKDNNHPSHCLFTPLSSRRRGLYTGSSTPHHGVSVELLSPGPAPTTGSASAPDLPPRQSRLERDLSSPHSLSPLSTMESTRDGVSGPLLSPGMKGTGTSPPPLEKQQQHLQPHHKPYSHYHHQDASDDYQGSFQSCFHFGDSYRMEQSVSGVHVPADSHGYTSHQNNGFHMSSTSSGSAAGFSLAQDLQGSGECQFSSSPEESIFFQVNSFDRSLSQMSSVYTET